MYHLILNIHDHIYISALYKSQFNYSFRSKYFLFFLYFVERWKDLEEKKICHNTKSEETQQPPKEKRKHIFFPAPIQICRQHVITVLKGLYWKRCLFAVQTVPRTRIKHGSIYFLFEKCFTYLLIWNQLM